MSPTPRSPERPYPWAYYPYTRAPIRRFPQKSECMLSATRATGWTARSAIVLLVDTPAHKGHQVQNFQFRELLGAPLVNGDTAADWEATERTIHITLPADYKEFVSAYGPGCINDQVYLFHPRAARGDHGLRLESLWGQASHSYGELTPSDPHSHRHPMYPEEGGYLAVARSISGNHIFLVPPDANTGQWQVAVEMGGWFTFEMTFADFLWAALREELDVPVIQGEPSFEQIGSTGFE